MCMCTHAGNALLAPWLGASDLLPLLFSPFNYRLSLSLLIPLAGALSKAHGTEKNTQQAALSTTDPRMTLLLHMPV